MPENTFDLKRTLSRNSQLFKCYQEQAAREGVPLDERWHCPSTVWHRAVPGDEPLRTSNVTGLNEGIEGEEKLIKRLSVSSSVNAKVNHRALGNEQ